MKKNKKINKEIIDKLQFGDYIQIDEKDGTQYIGIVVERNPDEDYMKEHIKSIKIILEYNPPNSPFYGGQEFIGQELGLWIWENRGNKITKL